MSYRFARCLFLVTLTVLFPPETSSTNVIVDKFHALLGAIDSAVSYSLRHYQEMNFDGVFSLWIVKGYLTHLLSTHSLWHDHLGNELLISTRDNLTRLLRTVDRSIPQVVRSVKEHDRPYFDQLGLLLNLRWYPLPPNALYGSSFSFTPFSNSTRDITFDEQLSDRCVSQLLLSNNSNRRCRPSPDCLELLTGNPSHGYELTHQVLYAIVLLELDCTSTIMEHLEAKGLTLFSLSLNLCARTYDELLSLLNLNTLSARQRDLLMEQIFVCSHIGFVRFNQLALLDLILSWQHPSGCFTDQMVTDRVESAQKNERRLLEEARLSDGCLAHMTSVATAALLSFLRRFFIASADGDRFEADLYRILLDKEYMEQNAFLPELLEPRQPDPSPIDRPWDPSVPYGKFEQLTRFHQIAPWLATRKPWRSSALNALSKIDVDSGTSVLFYCLSLFSLALCVLFCLRIRRRFCVAKYDRS